MPFIAHTADGALQISSAPIGWSEDMPEFPHEWTIPAVLACDTCSARPPGILDSGEYVCPVCGGEAVTRTFGGDDGPDYLYRCPDCPYRWAE